MEVASAIRPPTPDPVDSFRSSASKRKRSPSSRSPSPRRHPSPPRRTSRSPDFHPPRGPRHSGPSFSRPLPRDVDHHRAVERQRQFEIRQGKQDDEPKEVTAEQKQAAAKKEYDELLTKRSGGVYIPPARLRALQAQITDKNSKEFQRMAWEALKKSINGLINKVNISNIKHIVPELFGENLVRGRGLFCRSIMKAQAASLPFTPIFAATTAIVNTKLPQVGELLVNRLVVSFRKGFKRNDKTVCISTTTFLAHLVNQQVCHEMLAAQLLLLLLHKPTDDSVEIAVNLVKECGQHLEEMSGPIAIAVFDQFRNILHEATDLEKRTQYMIEVLFQVRKDKWKDYPATREELDLVEEEDQITHKVDLDGELDIQDGTNIFKFDPEYQEHEDAYKKLKAEILGEAEGSDEEYDSDASSEDNEEDVKEREMEIQDQTNTDLVNLRRSIYLTIKSSGTFEEACHKLMRINLPEGKEDELPSMVIECASQERTFDKFYGNIGERFCKLNRLWQDLFQEAFVKYYDTIHRYESNRLRIIAQFFGHLLSANAMGWQVFDAIHLNEDETTSSSRIFIKILFEELQQAMGTPGLTAALRDEALRPSLAGIFPTDDPRHTRFAINFFTAINMGFVTDNMREHLAALPQAAPPALRGRSAESDSDDSASSMSSYSSDSYSSRSRSESRSRSRSRSRSVSESRSPSRSRSRSPPRRSRPAPPPPPDRRARQAPQAPPRRRRQTSSEPSGSSRSRSGGPSREPSPSPSRSRSPYSRRPRPGDGRPGGQRDERGGRWREPERRGGERDRGDGRERGGDDWWRGDGRGNDRDDRGRRDDDRGRGYGGADDRRTDPRDDRVERNDHDGRERRDDHRDRRDDRDRRERPDYRNDDGGDKRRDNRERPDYRERPDDRGYRPRGGRT